MAAEFCAYQSMALELIKTKKRKETRFQQFMQVGSGHPGGRSLRSREKSIRATRKRAAGRAHMKRPSYPRLPGTPAGGEGGPAEGPPPSLLSAAPQEAESRPQCRRLQLKDLIIAEMQRLTKYPLLLENILKHSPGGCCSSARRPPPPARCLR